jgi:hypothetical protein
MTEVGTVLTVIGMFLIRIGIPLILLIALGTLIERWQRGRENRIAAMYAKVTKLEQKEAGEQEKVEKAA